MELTILLEIISAIIIITALFIEKWSSTRSVRIFFSSFATILSLYFIIESEVLLFRLLAVTAFIAFSVLLIRSIFFSKIRQPQLPSMDSFMQGPYTVRLATEEDIMWEALIERWTYRGVNVIPVNTMLKWYRANPNAFFVIEDSKKHKCGHLSILTLKETVLSRLMDGDIIERQIGSNDFVNDKNEIKCLYVTSFVTIHRDKLGKFAIGNPFATWTCLVRFPQIVKQICNPKQIEKIYALGATPEGKELCENLGFEEYPCQKKRKDKDTPFVIDFVNLLDNIRSIDKD